VWAPDDVRAGCAFVAERARLVRIDESRLETYAVGGVAPPDTSSVEFALTFNAINFGSGWHPYLSKMGRKSGNVTISTRLQERFKTDGPFTAHELTRLTADDCAALLHQHLHPPVDELMGLFAQSLNDLGRFLLERFDGSFHGPVEAAGGSAVRMVELLQAMPMYRDVSTYGGQQVPFLKRAQITASDIGTFSDLDRLTLFADNLIPHVLRLEGVLILDAELEKAIEREELLEPGGAAEVELRANAVHAVELLIAGLGGSVTARQIDNVLWRRGQEPRFKSSHRPRVRSVYY